MTGRSQRALLGLALVTGSYLGVRGERLARLDAAVERRLTSPRPRPVDATVAVATDLGSSFGLAGVTTVLALIGRRRAAAQVGMAGALAWVLAQGVKPALGRTRPYERGTSHRLVSPPAGSSWPSGHAAVAAAMAAGLEQAGGRRAARVMAVLAAGVGASRVAVGVHHASDVVAGAGVGLCAASLGGELLARAGVRTR
ncbi:MAG: phosphatase PAP2 family protein [Nitriliruptoraceae bacterium]